jgi:hypothetical protein
MGGLIVAILCLKSKQLVNSGLKLEKRQVKIGWRRQKVMGAMSGVTADRRKSLFRFEQFQF